MAEQAPTTHTTPVRRAGESDVPGIVALGAAVVPATYDAISERFAAAQLEQWWSRAAVTDSVSRLPHWVAEHDGEVTGVATLGTWQGEPVMWKLYVHPDHQGSGVGAALLAAVEAEVEGPALRLEYVDGNDRAAAFYAARGFVVTGRTPYEDFPQIDQVWMRKELGGGDAG